MKFGIRLGKIEIALLFTVLLIAMAIHFSKYYLGYAVTYWYNYLRFTPYLRDCYHIEADEDIEKNLISIKSEKLKTANTQKEKEIVNFLSEFIPLDVTEMCKTRIGRKNDGGYVMIEENLDKIEVIYVYGVSYDTYFEKDFIWRYPNSIARLYDFSIHYVPYHPKFYFYKEGLGAQNDEKLMLGTLEKHLTENKDLGKRMLLKVDIEGAEWESFAQIDKKHLLLFDQIVMELHNLGENIKLQTEVMKKVNENFYLYHVHGNNWIPMEKLSEKFKIPGTLEVSWIRKDLVDKVRVSKLKFPSRLDAPNLAGKEDIPLDFWPFVNTK